MYVENVSFHKRVYFYSDADLLSGVFLVQHADFWTMLI